MPDLVTPRDLTADKLTWLRNEAGNDQRHGLASTRVDHNDLVPLLAMASRLLELEAARKWLKENDGTVMSFHGVDEFIERAKRYGFPGLNAKGVSNV